VFAEDPESAQRSEARRTQNTGEGHGRETPERDTGEAAVAAPSCGAADTARGIGRATPKSNTEEQHRRATPKSNTEEQHRRGTREKGRTAPPLNAVKAAGPPRLPRPDQSAITFVALNRSRRSRVPLRFPSPVSLSGVPLRCFSPVFRFTSVPQKRNNPATLQP
jgi:hypothetical protein